MPYECAQQGALDRCGRWYHSNKLMISGDDLCLSYSQALEDEIERQAAEGDGRAINYLAPGTTIRSKRWMYGGRPLLIAANELREATHQRNKSAGLGIGKWGDNKRWAQL